MPLALLSAAATLIASPAPQLLAQAPATTHSATQLLLDKASTLESRGRMDMASQIWQQVLLADPKNTDALAGLARAAKLSGNTALANTYLDRLRAINPDDPNIVRIQTMTTGQTQAAQLAQAGRYAAAAQYPQAMTIYHQVFGNEPPPGDWAIAFYETEAAIDSSRAHAITGLRTLADRYPTEPRYAITLGRILSYNTHTRIESFKLLERYPDDPQAATALHQALVWDAQNPAAAADIRLYLTSHTDPQLAAALRAQAKLSTTRPLTPAEQQQQARNAEIGLAFHALNAKHLQEADQRFEKILAEAPDNPQALAGMGYVRMQQSNFAAATTFLDEARQKGAQDPGLEEALASARFYDTMAKGAHALDRNDLPTAERHYRAALALRPTDSDAFEALGGTLLKAHQPAAAADLFARYTAAKPSAPGAWRGLFMAQSDAGNPAQALDTDSRIPTAPHAILMRDPGFLRTLAAAYAATGNDAESQRVLRAALDLPFPANPAALKPDTQLEYAALLEQAHHFDQASALYAQARTADPKNISAWQGLIRTDHALQQDARAAVTLESMPPALRDQALLDPGFDSTVASIDHALDKLTPAQTLLEQAIARESAAGRKVPVFLETQLAGIYLDQKNAPPAFALYRQLLTAAPTSVSAWQGLLAALHTTGRDREALAQLQQIPLETRRALEHTVDYLQTVASVYSTLNQPRQALLYLNRIQQRFQSADSTPPANLEIQNAYVLLDQPTSQSNDSALYSKLMTLGSRTDLTDDQRRTVQTIWSLWAVRRANQAVAAGNPDRAVAILNAAAAAFPGNPAVLRTLAPGYVTAGLAKQAVAIFKSQNMSDANAGDWRSAIGAALAANDLKSADPWVHASLTRYPKDPELLRLAAKYAESRGDSHQAADYYHASLAALPTPNPSAALVAQLTTPAAAPQPHLPAAAQPSDIASLLAPHAAPGSQPAPQSTRPYLPGLGEAPIQPAAETPAFSQQSTPEQGSSPSSNTVASAQKPTQPATLGNYNPTAPVDVPRSTNPSAHAKPSTEPIQLAEADTPAPPTPYTQPAPFSTRSNPTALTPTQPPTRVAVQLGAVVPTAHTPKQPEVTDVLPTAHYLANPGPESKVRNNLLNGPDATSPSTPTARRVRHSDSYSQPSPQSAQPTPTLSPAAPQTASVEEPKDISLGATQPSAPEPPRIRPVPANQYSDLLDISEQLPENTTPGKPTAILSEREQAELDLSRLEGAYSAWTGTTPVVRYRSGTPGVDRLIDIESPTEASVVIAQKARLTVVAQPVTLSSGTMTSTALTTSGTTPILGTLTGSGTAPDQQRTTGVGGELQLATRIFDASAGYTPYEFLAPNITARLRLRAGRHLTLFADRQPVKETQLSYAGLRDPANPTNLWGGVIATGGGVRIDAGGARHGVYLSADSSALTGTHVLSNRKIEGTTGAYVRLKNWPHAGSLNLGVTAFGMHFDNNQLNLTYGSGGYFSPERFVLAAVPASFTGHSASGNLHYTVGGSAGVQSYHSAYAPYYPLDAALETSAGNSGFTPSGSTGVNYAANAQLAYRLADHWYAGGFLTANNSNGYDTVTGGFSLRFLFTPQYPTEDTPTGLFPTEGIRPLRVP